MTRRAWCAFAVALLIAPVLLAASASADKCGIPLDRDVEFDESAQNAIAAWNGQKECLILSTDLRSSQPGRLMEMLPLPSAPYDIQEGNIGSFKTIITLYNDKMKRLDVSPDTSKGERSAGLGGDAVSEFQGIEVVFSSSVGLHNITVVKIESTDHFLRWAQSFADAQGVSNLSINERLNQSVGDHLDRGISYFVFDIVDVTSEKRTAEPLVYLFNTSFLYYPLKITYDSLPEGRRAPNEISVFLIADGVVRQEKSYVPGVHFTGGVDEYIEFTKSELGKVFGPLGALFSQSAFVAHLSGRMYVYEYSPESVRDVVLGSDDLRRPTVAEMLAQYERADFLRAIKPLSPSLGYYLLRSVYEPGYAPPTFFLALILLGIFVGPIALGLMFKGITERGNRRSHLWIAWLTLYGVGIAGILGIMSLTISYSGSAIWFLVLYLVLFLPLFAVLYLGERFKTRPAAGKHTVSISSFGMALVQVLAFLFVPSSIVALPIAVVCFPVVGITGIIVIAITLLARRKAKMRPAWTPPPPHGPYPPRIP
jgi:hypothetical protein